MKQEIEAKFFPINEESILQKLKSLKAKPGQQDVLMRRAVFDKSQNPQIKCTYARVRDEGKEITASLKINASENGKVEDQKELKITVNSFEDTRDFLNKLGLVETGYQENIRSTWFLRDSEIVIDEWPALDTYIEIESPNSDELKFIVDDLGLKWEEKILVSTDELYAKKYSITKEEALRYMSLLTFEDIPEIFSH